MDNPVSVYMVQYIPAKMYTLTYELNLGPKRKKEKVQRVSTHTFTKRGQSVDFY